MRSEPIDRAEATGLGLAVAAHVALFLLLSTVLVARSRPLPPLAQPIDIQIVDKVGLVSAAPKAAVEAPAPVKAPEKGEPEPDEAPPPPAPTPEPPKPKPEPPKPAPKAEPKPAPTPKPSPKVEKPPPKPAPAKPAPAAAKPKPAAPAAEAPAKPSKQAGKGKRDPRAEVSNDDFLKGITPEKSPGKAQAPRVQAISALAMNGLVAAIARQIQPCYELGSLGGTPAMRIVTTLNLRFNKDGSVSGSPTMVNQAGIDDDNRGYAKQIAEVGRRAVLRCAPLKLPPELYAGGWENLNFRFTPGQMSQ